MKQPIHARSEPHNFNCYVRGVVGAPTPEQWEHVAQKVESLGSTSAIREAADHLRRMADEERQLRARASGPIDVHRDRGAGLTGD